MSQTQSIFTHGIGIIMLAKMLRMFSLGILSIIFLGSMLDIPGKSDEISLSMVVGVVVCILENCIFLALTRGYDEISFNERQGLIKMAGLKFCCFVFYWLIGNYFVLVVSGFLGCLYSIEGEIGLFAVIQKKCIILILQTNKTQIRQPLGIIYGYYSTINFISISMGSLLTAIYLKNTPQNYIQYLTISYILLWLLIILCYSQLKIDQQRQKHNQRIKYLQNYKIIGTTFLEGLIHGFLMYIFIGEYLQAKFRYEIYTMGILLGFINLFTGLSNMFAYAVTKKWGYCFVFFICCIENLMIILTAFLENRKLALIFILGRYLISGFNVVSTKQYEQHIQFTQESQNKSLNLSFSRNLGIIVSMLGCFIYRYELLNRPAYTKVFIICGGLRILCSLLALKDKSRFFKIKNQSGFTQLEETKEMSDS